MTITGRKPTQPKLQNLPTRTELGREIEKGLLWPSLYASKPLEFPEVPPMPTEGFPVGDITQFMGLFGYTPRRIYPDYAIIEGLVMQRMYKDGKPTDTYVHYDMEAKPDVEGWMKEHGFYAKDETEQVRSGEPVSREASEDVRPEVRSGETR